ncbi:MAG: endonuclease III [Candidatus Babeliales bacterium]
MDKKERAIRIIQILRKATKSMEQPASVNIVNQYGQDPYLVLISCLLSLRTKDTVSFPASQRLFEYAKTPAQMLKIPIKTIEKLIYPTGFYHRKAILLHEVSKDLLERFKGKVPKTEQELLSIKGVGRKTANLVLGVAFDIPAICVDTHVHRISNRLGLVKTKTTDETEVELKKILPPEYWTEYNHLLVIWGQNICVPISPHCSKCAIAKLCPRIGVTKHR